MYVWVGIPLLTYQGYALICWELKSSKAHDFLKITIIYGPGKLLLFIFKFEVTTVLQII